MAVPDMRGSEVEWGREDEDSVELPGEDMQRWPPGWLIEAGVPLPSRGPAAGMRAPARCAAGAPRAMTSRPGTRGGGRLGVGEHRGNQLPRPRAEGCAMGTGITARRLTCCR
jgi:hypothetical protein